jgi:DNA-binding response OmpR family regulator
MVYIVDDDADDREILQHALFQYSYKGPVQPFENGKVLLDKMTLLKQTERPGVIILDLNMPLLSGFQVLEHLKQSDSLDSTRIIVLTSSDRHEDEVRSFELGCDFFMTKPARVSEYAALTIVVKKFLATGV